MAALTNCPGTKRMLTYPNSKIMEISSSSSKDVFILVHSEQKQCEDSLIEGGGGGESGGSGYLFPAPSNFFKFTIRNCIEFPSENESSLHETPNW